jgi:hypothetical protein
MRSKTLGATLAALAALAVGAAPAGAVVANTPNGRVGYLPLNGSPASAAAPKGFTEPTGEPPLVYHGGPVMHSQEAYAIFWAPSGFTFPSGYTAAIEEYLENVASDSGKPSNVYSVSAQYDEGGTGNASYSDTFGESVTDTNAYPTSGTCAPYSGAESFTACITDAKLEDEVESVVNAEGWPDGLEAEYYVVLPPHVGSCFETAGNVCFDKQFCAYHSFSEPAEDIYANISYSPGDVIGCGVGEYPNGFGTKGNVDDTLSSLSHEANESITDPTLEAWFDEAEEPFENGDECRNSSDDFGPPLGGGSGTLFNQEIGGAHYYLQQEWSNDINDCAQRVTPAKPKIAEPDPVYKGESASFDGSGSVPGAGGIESYEWNFGDTGTATGPTPSHTYASTGPFTITLTVEDDGGFVYATAREVTVTEPPPKLPPEVSLGTASGVSDSGATLHGGVNPKGRHAHYHFEYGLTTAYGSSTPNADAGSGLGEVAVTAGLSGLEPSTTYHFRLVASNVVGPTKTGDSVFTTAATPPTPAAAPVSPPPPPPPPPACKVPKLAGLTLAKAKTALATAHCKLGRVAKPKAKKGGKAPVLVVKSSSPAVGAKPAGGTVNLTLGPKPKPKKHHHPH